MKYRITTEDKLATVALEGNVDETTGAALLEIQGLVAAPRVIFDCASLRLINSTGISKWIAGLHDIAAKRSIEFARCSRTFVHTANLVARFHSCGVVTSVYMPFYCERCGTERDNLVPLDDAIKMTLKTTASCEACGEVIELEVDPEDYLSFARPESA
jgi:hypothetical protein